MKNSKFSDFVLLMAIVLIFMANFQCIVTRPATRQQSDGNFMTALDSIIEMVLSSELEEQDKSNEYDDRIADDFQLIRNIGPKSILISKPKRVSTHAVDGKKSKDLVVRGGKIGD